MTFDVVFSWAENERGELVHVDSVPNGKNCGCVCPCCHEELLARHGGVREHGFAHKSEVRRANLKICYAVTMLKLAEQIIQKHKKILVPSYYGIIQGGMLEFSEVELNSEFERNDRQPDVLAIAEDGSRYLIEFTFGKDVRHKQIADYSNIACIRIDLAKQNLDGLEDFLLKSTDNKYWLNHNYYFNSIKDIYAQKGHSVRLVNIGECNCCDFRFSCCGVRNRGSSELLEISNNNERYRICRPDIYEKRQIEEREKERLLSQYSSKFEPRRSIEPVVINKVEKSEDKEAALVAKRDELLRKIDEEEASRDANERTCFECRVNIKWKNEDDGYAFCGMSSKNCKVHPCDAITCNGFRRVLGVIDDGLDANE